MPTDVAVIGLYILDGLGRPVAAIPEGGGVDFIDQIRLTVAGLVAGGLGSDAGIESFEQTLRAMNTWRIKGR